MPFAEDGKTVSGLWLAATVIFLLFVASICLVIACIAPGPAKEDKKAGKKD